MSETTDPRWRIVADRDDQPWPCTIIDADGRGLLGIHNGTPVIRSRELAERIVNALNADPVRDTEAVHWVGDAPTSLHGNGAGSFARTTRDATEVTCRLCLSILELDPPARAPDRAQRAEKALDDIRAALERTHRHGEWQTRQAVLDVLAAHAAAGGGGERG